ncbi:MAG: hypothetical protein GH144_08610 [Clostridia bacterium]|jgi:uroporphyrinogen-III decarboxylase|nr:hypothetical protein [Clostridia bacterium]
MDARENYLRAIEFRNPQWIPITVYILPAAWMKYREDLEKIILRHPKIFRHYKKGNKDFDECPLGYRKGYYRDNWGCLWYNLEEGILGQVVEHPLSDWKFLDTYKPPDPFKKGDFGEYDWDEIKRTVEEQKKKGLLTSGSGGQLFTRLWYLRGFENLMMDIATDDPHLLRLIEMLTDYALKLVNEWLKIGVDIIGFHTDIGGQNSLMISPTKFRKYIKPMFKKIFMTYRKAGMHVFLSSDGCLLEIIDDLVECGVSVHDPQFRANTLEGILKAYKAKLCAMVDLDQQEVLPFGTPKEIDKHVRDVVKKLNSSRGGLMIYTEIQQTYPLRNIEAIFEALEKYCLPNKNI